MQRILAIAKLTWKAAFRFRLFWVLAGLLLLSVVGLPLLLKDDGTARGFIQIMLTYTLSVITVLLGTSTLWLACGSLARDIEDCQIQMVAVKPVARWQIWLGKWLGLLALNAALLVVAGGGVYALLQWRAAQLPDRQREILRNEIFVARASLREPKPDIDADTARVFAGVPGKEGMSPEQLAQIQEQLRARVLSAHQLVPPGTMRQWTLELGLQRHRLKDAPLYVRFKFHVAQTNLFGLYRGEWQFGPTNSPLARTFPQSLAADAFHEMQIPPNLFDENGTLTIFFRNIYSGTEIMFPLEDGLEVLYREGGFGLNFVRGLGIIFCWLALLASVGLAASSLLSFPVAAFFSASVLIVVMSTGTLASVVAEGTVTGLDHETGVGRRSLVDFVLLPLFQGILHVVGLAEAFSPVESLSTGRSITWGQLGLAFLRIVLLLGGLVAAAGILTFTRRELATAQGTS